jgi:hypothetical protein
LLALREVTEQLDRGWNVPVVTLGECAQVGVKFLAALSAPGRTPYVAGFSAEHLRADVHGIDLVRGTGGPTRQLLDETPRETVPYQLLRLVRRTWCDLERLLHCRQYS